MVNKAQKIDFLITKNETEALQLEENLIKKNKPPFNSLLRDNNHFVYIKFTKDPYPQIFIVKQRKNDGATYIGPKYHSKELRNFLHYFRQLFGYRGCKNTQFKQGKLCSDYHFGLCQGRCNSELQQKNTNLNSKNYHKILKKIQKFFEGNTKSIEKEIQSQMDAAIAKQNFERAAKLRDLYYHIEILKEKQSVIIDPKLQGNFIQIQQIGNRRVFVALHFFEGKLIDIITNKISSLDTDYSSLINNFKSEFGDPTIIYGPKNLQKSFSIVRNPKVKSSEILSKDLTPLFQNFLDSYISKTTFENNNLMNDLLHDLQSKYQLQKFPYHIECVDISHFNGERNSGGLSCFIGGIPDRKYYRRYKIEQNNDYDSLKELLTRRAKSENYPDLMILDGGKGQLNILKDLAKSKDKYLQKFLQTTEFISLGKGSARSRKGKQSGETEIIRKLPSPDRRGAGGEVKQELNTSFPLSYDQTDQILIKIRNEAHRFANSYREKQMSKTRK